MQEKTKTAEMIPVKSVVQVHFPARNTRLAYFNDQFDLHIGDIVYVEGKMEGQRGQVVDITYNFKIKVSDYKRVIGKADTAVDGSLYMLDSHFVAFSPDVIPYEKVITWYRAPESGEEEYVVGNDETRFRLSDLSGLVIGEQIEMRGRDYYLNHRVRYICLEGNRGRAIVLGTEAYVVEFIYEDGWIRNLVCDCFCSYTCKHEFAAVLQLQKTLALLKERYPERMNQDFAAIEKADLFSFAVDSRRRGVITLGEACAERKPVSCADSGDAV